MPDFKSEPDDQKSILTEDKIFARTSRLWMDKKQRRIAFLQLRNLGQVLVSLTLNKTDAKLFNDLELEGSVQFSS